MVGPKNDQQLMSYRKKSRMYRRIQELKLGGKVERRRREPSRGVEWAKGGRAWGGKTKKGLVPLRRKKFQILRSKWRIFVDSVLIFVIFL